MNIKLNRDIINNIDISNILESVSDSVERKNVIGLSGVEHYRLLSYLSTQFNNELFCDIGTCKGSSALALSSNRNNTVVSFGIEERIIPVHETIKYIPQTARFSRPPNVDFIICDDFLFYGNLILNSKLIFLDIDHSGVVEKRLYNFLLSNNYKGLLLLDDIFIEKCWKESSPGESHSKFKEMTELWENAKNNKNTYDLTHYGHFCGTGLIDFSNSLNIIFE